MTDYEAFQKYMAIRLHFGGSYDYFKYKGKTKTSLETFDNRKDKYYFKKLAKVPDLELFIALSMFDNVSSWVGGLFDEINKERLNDTLKIVQSLSYKLKEQLQRYESFDDALNTTGSVHPKIFKDYRQGLVPKEILIVLNNHLNIFEYWDGHLKGDLIWTYEKTRLEKLAGFIDYDKKSIESLLFTLY